MNTPDSSHRAKQLGLASFRKQKQLQAEQEILAMDAEAIPFLLRLIEEQQRFTARHGIRFLGPTRLQNRAVPLLAQIATKEQIGPLIDLMDSDEEVYYGAVRAALIRIFQDLRASDSPRLTLRHRKILAAKLMHPPVEADEEEVIFFVVLLKALMQVGDGSFLKPVEWLIAQLYQEFTVPIFFSARRSLPALRAFAEQEAKSGRLVRAVAQPEEALLRPAGNSDPESPLAPLVRAVEDTE